MRYIACLHIFRFIYTKKYDKINADRKVRFALIFCVTNDKIDNSLEGKV